MKKCVISLILYFIFFNNFSFSEEIPIIVISAGKASQSKGTVGSDIEILNSETLTGTGSGNQLGDVIADNISGANYSNQGGVGTNSLIQLRGLPKRYSTVYIDGIKLSDPSSPDNAFYFNSLTTQSVDTVEILKGNQSSLYGSGAVGGVINIFSKNANSKDLNNFAVSYGSNNTKNLEASYGAKNNKHEYYFALNNYLTDGISAMSDNSEKDSYKNNNAYVNYGYNFSENFKLQTGLRYIDTLINYDEVTSGRADNNISTNNEYLYNLSLANKINNFNHKLIYGKYYIERQVSNFNNTTKDTYYGERDSINYLTEYNFDNDNRIITGLENEFDRASFKTWTTNNINKITDSAIYSQFFDIEFRPLEKLYGTFGARNDHHEVAGDYQTGRLTLAYKLDNLSKIRSSIGTGIRFGSLNDYYYDTNVSNKKTLKPEKSESIDFGFDKNFPELGLDLNTTVFFTRYKDNISNWQTNTDGGRNTDGFVIQNSSGEIRSKGLEISSRYKLFKDTNLRINYAYINAYDGEDFDDPNYSGGRIDTRPVRVPDNSLNIKLERQIANLNSAISYKFQSDVRDYGNTNNNFKDVILPSFQVFNFTNSFNLNDSTKIYLNLMNIFDEKYMQAYQYSTYGRNLNIGLKQSF
jgi:vitamin B12 transporter